MKPISNFLLVTFFSSLFISTIITAQVKINERVEIKESNTAAAPTKNAPRQIDAVKQTIRVELSFAPYSYPWPGTIPIGHIEGEIQIVKISGGVHTVLKSTGKVTGGNATLNYDIGSPASGYIQRYVRFRFSTSLGHAPSKHNSGSASVEGKVYLNNGLEYSYSNANYSDAGTFVFIRPWSCEKNLEISEPAGTETVHIFPGYPDSSKTVVKAKLNNYAQGDVTFNFELTLTPPILSKNSLSRTNSVLSGEVVVQNSDIAEWEIPWDESVIGGENTKLTVAAFAGETACSKEVSDPYEIIVEGCNEPIEECDSNEPQIFDVSSVEVLGENQEWQWTDKNGNLQRTNTGSACDYLVPTTCDTVEFGKTYIMPSIGDYASQGSPIYNQLDDMDISACLDKSDADGEYWQFNVSNLRVPIFIDECPDQAVNLCLWIDLGDGTNSSLLSKYIGDCKSYRRILDIVEWWKKGAYWNEAEGKKPLYNVYFSAGVMPHETIHLQQIRDTSLVRYMNDEDYYGFKGIRKLRLPKNGNPCPEDALQQRKENVKNVLRFTLNSASDLETALGTHKNGQPNSELNADIGARAKYDEIKANIKSWAEGQSWWNPNCNP
ncbi:hypothetical protein ACFLR4_00425 [Bacteroidota bacterium]